MEENQKSKNPLTWIPFLYFAQGFFQTSATQVQEKPGRGGAGRAP